MLGTSTPTGAWQLAALLQTFTSSQFPLAPFDFLFAGVVNHLHNFCYIGIHRAAFKVPGKRGVRLVAYRWDGEQTLSSGKYVWVERVEP